MSTASLSFSEDPVSSDTRYLSNGDGTEKVGGIRRPISQSIACHDRYITNVIEPNVNGSAPTRTGKGGKYTIELDSSNIPGQLENLFVECNITSSASADGFYNRLITDLEIELPNGKTRMQDDLCTCFDNTAFWSDEDIKGMADSMGFSSTTLFAKDNVSTAAEIKYINIMNPFLRALRPYMPAFVPGYKIKINFRLNALNDFMATDTTPPTLTINSVRLLAFIRIPTAIEVSKIINSYRYGLTSSFIEYQPSKDLTISGTTEANDQLDIVGYSAGLLIGIRDDDVTVNDASLDYCAWSKYRITDSAGNTLFYRAGSEYINKNLQSIIDSMSLPGTLLHAKNLLLAQTGPQFNGILEALKTGADMGGHDFRMNDRLRIVSTVAGADKMLMWQLLYRKFYLVWNAQKNGVEIAKLEDIVASK